jgi:TolA-binding protein
MAGWMTALKLVPWGEVVKSAPQIAEGARKLWQSVGAGQRRAKTPEDVPVAVAGNEVQAIAALTGRITQLERELAEASGLIHSMAEQDKQLVGQMAQLQQRLRRQAVMTVVLALGMLAIGVHLLSR